VGGAPAVGQAVPRRLQRPGSDHRADGAAVQAARAGCRWPDAPHPRGRRALPSGGCRRATRPRDRRVRPRDAVRAVTNALPGLARPRSPAGSRSAAADYTIERRLRASAPGRGEAPVRIAGVDEVGRGAWAGPVVVCAAVTDLSPPPTLPGRGGSAA